MFDNLNKFAIQQLGFGPVGEVRILTNGSSNSHLYFRDKVYETNLHTSVWQAEAAMVTQRNDVMLVTPESHIWLGDAGVTVTTLTWDKQSTHMVGMDGTGRAGYQRARFGQNSVVWTDVSLLTVSGASNIFKNLRFMHGVNTHDHYCLKVSGAGNRFENVCFAGPSVATQGASADYASVELASATSNYFKDCVFGTNNDVDRSAANCILKISGTGGGANVFEDCVFISRSGGGQSTAIFINDAHTGTVVGWNAIFLNCQFLHTGATLTEGITKAAAANRYLYFDNRCTFVGVTDQVTAGQEANIIWGGSGRGPDTVAAYDNKGMGKGTTVVATH